MNDASKVMKFNSPSRGKFVIEPDQGMVKTNPGKGWWSAFRTYGPQVPAFDVSRNLNDIEELKSPNQSNKEKP
jgi:hypothetical protein